MLSPQALTPLDTVLRGFSFPLHIVPHPLQIDTINRLGPINNSGLWLDMGTGKTFVSTVMALYHAMVYGHRVLVIMPPNLITQWAYWLASITPALSVCMYRGTPAQRKQLSFDAHFVLVGIQIFKRDYERFVNHFQPIKFTTIVDEATMLSGVHTDSHQKVMDLTAGQPQILLTGTPANKPTDAYGLMKFTAPGTYRNLKHFESLHIEERDFFGNPCKYMNLELLHQNLLINSARVLFSDMYSEAQEPLYVPVNYELEPAHQKLYRKLAEEELLALPDGSKIDATSANALRHALGQIVVNPGNFSGNPDDVSATVALIEEKLDELGDQKLVVFADYKMTVRNLCAKLQKYGALPYNGEVSQVNKDAYLQRFLTDPKCRVIVIQFISGGKGLDGLQHVCHHALFAEPCRQPRDFHQCVARLRRMGQKNRVMVMMAIARGTLQVRGFKSLIENDELINKVVRNMTDLRKLIYGE